jgi:hypothetical protein
LGPYALTSEIIDLVVIGKGPGTYILGHLNQNADLVVFRAGRSDVHLNKRLHDYVGMYKAFKYGFAPSAAEAFQKECRLYHDFSPPDNAIHPDRPEGANWTCPCCALFD